MLCITYFTVGKNYQVYNLSKYSHTCTLSYAMSLRALLCQSLSNTKVFLIVSSKFSSKEENIKTCNGIVTATIESKQWENKQRNGNS